MARRRRERAGTGTLPGEVTLAYYEPARDFQVGLQRARRRDAGARTLAIELAAALAADEARGLAEAALARAWARRETAVVRLPWRWAAVAAGGTLSLGGEHWRVRERTLEHLALELVLEREGPAAAALPASAGRATTDQDAPAGETVIVLLDLPALDDRLADAPLVWLAAAGRGPGWRRAEASLSFDGGATWSAIGRTAAPATIGAVAGTLGPGPRELIDRVNAVEVELLHEGMSLASASAAGLAVGANLAAIGDELLQFGTGEQLTATRWRLRELWRGRRGSDFAIGGHGAGERFVLIDPATLVAVDVPLARLGSALRVGASGPGDAGAAATAEIVVAGAAVRPPAPVALDARRLGDGTIRLAWTRRSRAGWTWLDGTDAPLGEDAERYVVEWWHEATRLRVFETEAAGCDYAPGDQLADGWSGGTIEARVRQLGTRAASVATAAAWIF